MNNAILKLLQQGYTVITPTGRLSRYLANSYARHQVSSGRLAWESPRILPWHSWLSRINDEVFQSDEEGVYLLSAEQVNHIWSGVISASPFADDLLHVNGVARQARRAFEDIHHWCIPLFPNDVFVNQDARVFQSWAEAYRETCSAGNWYDESTLPELLIKRLGAGNIRLDMRLALVGYDELYPQQRKLLDSLQDAGADLVELPTENRARSLRAGGFSDTPDEIDAAANWARELLLADADARLGIIVPRLSSMRSQIEEQFDRVLLSANLTDYAEVESRPYSIALGQALNEYPLVAAALDILKLVRADFDIEEAGTIICSPWTRAAEAESAGRYLLDAALREHGETSFTINELVRLVAALQGDETPCPVLLDCLVHCRDWINEQGGSRSAGDWAKTFSKILELFGWPGERSMNSQEYQTFEAWHDLLLEFSTLGMVTPVIGRLEALSELNRLASSFRFQAETEETRLQIMGATGAAGMAFDHLWLMDMQEETWPPPVAINPFIPLSLQTAHGLPFASAEGCLQYTERVTASLLQSSPDVLVSYPMHDGDRVLRPSPLFRAQFTGGTELQFTRMPAYAGLVKNSSTLEVLEDSEAAPLPTGKAVRGGSGLFRDQAACPFRAWARHRLAARGLAEADIGLDPLDRGQLVHAIMHRVAEQFADRHGLEGTGGDSVRGLVEQQVTSVLMAYRRKRPKTLTDNFLALEKKRLEKLVLEWLFLEKQRDDFRVIACEQALQVELAGIEINLRIDRIDELGDGRQVLIDYKTGPVKASAWFGERPEDPQLPLYAVSGKMPLAALVFGRISAGDVRFEGLADGEDLLPGVKSLQAYLRADAAVAWQTLLDDWQETLVRLGTDFRLGKAAVDPRDVQACQHCDLHGFCRVNAGSPGGNDENGG